MRHGGSVGKNTVHMHPADIVSSPSGSASAAYVTVISQRNSSITLEAGVSATNKPKYTIVPSRMMI